MSVRIDFVRQQRWVHVWVICVAACAAIGAASAVHIGGQQQRIKVSSAQTAAARLQLQALQQQAQKATHAAQSDPNLGTARAAAAVLRLDLNPVFSVVENISEPGTRLAAVQFESDSQRIRLEYTVETLAHAASVTVALNTGFDVAPWKLEAVSSGSAMNSPEGGAQGMRASWSGLLSKLNK